MNPKPSRLFLRATGGGLRFLHGWRACWIGAFALSLHLFAPSAFAGPDQATWDANCGASGGCHATPANGAQHNGANATSVITAANALHGMGKAAFLGAGSNLADMATYLASVTTTAGSNVNVAYHGTTGTLTIPNVTLNDAGAGAVTSYGGSASYGTVNGTGTTALTYTHTANHCGSDTVTAYGQGSGTTSNRTVPITISPLPTINAPSPTVSISYSTGAQNISLGGTTNVLGITITGAPANGTAGVVNTNTLSYAADATTYKAQVTIGYRGEGPGYGTANSCGSSNGTATVNVGLPPAPTVANIGTLTVSSATPTNIDVTSSISGVVASNPSATYAVVASQPTAGGSGSSGVAGNIITYTPPGGFTGTTTITYTKAGPGGTSNTGTITLNVSAAPLVATASATTAYNTPVSINLASSITSSTTVTAVTPSAQTNGVATQTGPTTIQFTPTNGFFGTGTFLYTATNGGGTSGTALVTVTVNPPLPTVSPTFAIIPYNTATAINLSSSIGPVGATVLSVTPSGAVGGTALATGPTTITFTPTPGRVGAASFNYSASNVTGTSAGTATVSVTVSAPSPPTTLSSAVFLPANGPSVIQLGQDISGLFTSANLVALPANGVATMNGTAVTYTPNAGFTGSDSFTFNATGVGGTSNVSTVSISVISAPLTPSINRTTPINKPLVIDLNNVLASNVNSVSVFLMNNGLAQVNGKQITYTPKVDFTGRDTFSYVASTSTGVSSTPGTITVDVLPLPTAKAASLNVPLNTPTSLDLGPQISGGSISGITLGTAPQHGTVKVSGTSVTYTPATDYVGADSFTYIGVDSVAGNSLPATVSVTVFLVAPTVKAVTLSVPRDSSGSVDLASSISGSAITGIGIDTPPKQGTATVTGTLLTYTPKAGFFGQDTLTFVAYGAAGKSSPGSVKVTVTGEPDPAKDTTVTSTISGQVQAAMGMARSQVANFARHSERSNSSRNRNSFGWNSLGSAVPSNLGSVATSPTPTYSPYSLGQPAMNQPAALASLMPNATQLPLGTAPASLPLSTGLTLAANDLGISGSPLYALASGLVQNRSIDLGAIQQTFGQSTGTPVVASTKLWVEGVASFGVRDANGNISGANFSSTGITVGVDQIINDKLTIGLGVGYAQDTTRIGTDGSRSESRGYSVAVYGNYMPGENLFVEGLLGIGGFDFDTRRYVQPLDDFALSTRRGYQYFGSVGAGYEWRGKTAMISPYARLEFSSDRLGESTETGAGIYALTYYEQPASSMQGVLGLRGESVHATPFGYVVPRARLEWREDLRQSSEASIAYAEQVGGTRYSINSTDSRRSALVWGIGGDLLFRDGWALGLDYQLSRVSASESSFALRVRVTKELGVKGMPKLLQGVDLDFNDDNDIQIDAGYTWDDNITRGKVASDILVDNLYTLNMGKTWMVPLNGTSRLLLTAAAGGERFQNFNGLSKYTLTGEATYQYKGSAEFDAATWGLFGKVTGEDYQSELRDGYRYSLGVSVLQPLTNKITVSGALSSNVRRARSEVFGTRDASARFNIDYSLGRGATLYLGGEYRKGDLVSTGLSSLENISIAKMLVQDDAFDANRFISYRLDASTWLTTIGYNVGLGPRDSFDLSWRRVLSTPDLRPSWATSPTSYINNQLSMSYLMRF